MISSIYDWQDGLDSEKESSKVLGITDNNISYLGKDIKNIFNIYIKCVDPMYRLSKITEFWVDYINGIAFHPLADNVYYFIQTKNDNLFARRDETRSPRKTKIK